MRGPQDLVDLKVQELQRDPPAEDPGGHIRIGRADNSEDGQRGHDAIEDHAANGYRKDCPHVQASCLVKKHIGLTSDEDLSI